MNAAVVVAVWISAAPAPERLPAEVEDAYAVRFNPAGLGRLPGAELRLLGGRERSDRLSTDYGLGAYAATGLFGATSIAVGFESNVVDGDVASLLTLGLGAGRGPLSFGVSYARSWPRFGDDGSFWTLGAQLQPVDFVRLGFAMRDVGQSVMPRQYDTGLAVQPFSRLTLSTRWRYEEGETLNKDTLDLAFRGEIEPLRGLRVGALADVDGRVLLQLSLNLERLSVGGQVDVDDGDPGFTTEVVLRSHRLAGLTTVRRVALLELSGTLRPAPAFSIFSGGFRAAAYGALPLYLERLRQDDEVAGVFARIGPLDIGWGKAEEIRASLVRLRKSGRRVDCELTGTDDKAYFLATACSTIVMPPPIQLAVNGVQAQLLFVKDALDRYGVEAEVYRRDEFKTSPETYIKRGISPAQRKSLGRYIERVNTVLIDSISEGRDLDRPYVEAVLRKGVVTSTEAVALKLIDGVKYPDEVEKWVRSKYSGRITLARGREALQPERPRWSTPPAIAVIHVDATIASGRSRSLPFGLGRSVGAQDLVETIEAVRRSKRYVAAVLRVDSPGGGAYASDIIARAVRKLAKEKPVIASFGDVAASGGYYVASGARVIYAQPMTLTGSIGVFSLRFSAETLFRRLGINAERLGAGVGSPSPYLSATPLERKIAQKGVDYAYQQFLRTVALGRRTDVEKIAAVAGGRVWTGAEAKDRGLVDELGGFVAALQRAKAEAGLTPNTRVQVVDLPGRIQPLTLPSRLIQAARALGGAPSADVGEAFAGRWLPDLTRLLVPLVDMTFTQPKEPLAWFPMSLSVD